MIGFVLNIVVEQICGNDNVLNHLSIPAACFTHPEISMVGLTEVDMSFNYKIQKKLPASHFYSFFLVA